MKAIEIKNLSFKYNDGFEVLKNINLTIEKGKYYTFLGHNGSGKSTLAKVIVGLLPNYTGEIFINGILLNKDNISKIRKYISMVFQNPDNQFIGNTVEDDIAFGLENICMPHERMAATVREYAKKVGMDLFLDKEPSYLSGGQKQRVAIAGVLALGPKIIILDEATSMLDPKGKREILELINQIKKQDEEITIISITHDVEEAYKSDYTYILNHGEIKAFGEPKEVFKNIENIQEYNLRLPLEVMLKNRLNQVGYKIPDDADLKAIGDIICQSK